MQHVRRHTCTCKSDRGTHATSCQPNAPPTEWDLDATAPRSTKSKSAVVLARASVDVASGRGAREIERRARTDCDGLGVGCPLPCGQHEPVIEHRQDHLEDLPDVPWIEQNLEDLMDLAAVDCNLVDEWCAHCGDRTGVWMCSRGVQITRPH
jgi:hypothetical protein